MTTVLSCEACGRTLEKPAPECPHCGVRVVEHRARRELRQRIFEVMSVLSAAEIRSHVEKILGGETP